MGLLGSILKNSISNGISNGISKGINNAVSGAVQKAVNPVAEKWANKAAEDLDNAAGTMEKDAKATGGAFANLKAAAENYANAMEKVANEAGYASGRTSVEVTPAMLVEDGIPASTKIRNVLAQFPQYEVKENVSPATLGGEGKFKNYDFAVYQGGTPKLLIMLVGKTTCNTRLYRWSKEVADKNGVKMINFVEHYPNNVAYIKARLEKFL